MPAHPIQVRAPAQRTPAIVAIERMAKLAASGASPSKMVGAVDDVLIQWGAEGLEASDLRERVEQLQGNLDVGYEAAQDFAAEAETPAAKSMAVAQLVALDAAKARLAKVIDG